jgi:hypothetical protein
VKVEQIRTNQMLTEMRTFDAFPDSRSFFFAELTQSLGDDQWYATRLWVV